MQVLAISKGREGTTPEKLVPHLQNEVKHTLGAYLDGQIRNFWFMAGRRGIVFILESKDEAEARQVLSEFPLAAAGLVDFDTIPLQALKPLGILIGREFGPKPNQD